MAFGRYKRNKRKIKRAHQHTLFDSKNPIFNRKLHTVTAVSRDSEGRSAWYVAETCLRTRQRGTIAGSNRSCADGTGRTPQSAVAKSYKNFAQKIARRGRSANY